VTDDDLRANLQKAKQMLFPIDIAIKQFQGDSLALSKVYDFFLNLPKKVDNMTLLNNDEKQYYKDRIAHRFKFMYGDCHGVGYLLDPCYLGEGMPHSEKRELLEFIGSFPINDIEPCSADRAMELTSQLTAYLKHAKEMKKMNGKLYQSVVDGRVSVLDYWTVHCDEWPLLQDIAIKVFNCVASSAGSERNFSTMGFIHDKRRNKLGAEKVEMLVYIKTNYYCFQTDAEKFWLDNYEVTEDDDVDDNIDDVIELDGSSSDNHNNSDGDSSSDSSSASDSDNSSDSDDSDEEID
jgi:hypothetical protein